LDEGELTSRIDISATLTADTNKLKEYLALKQKFPGKNNWIRFGYLKGFIDGTIGSATALMFDPYNDDPSNTGLALMTYEELEKQVITADRYGFQIGIHAIGDKGNNWLLNAYEKASEVNGRPNSRYRDEHAQTITKSDIPRFASLGVIASMQPTHCISDKKFCEKRIGETRAEGAYAWKSLQNSGAKVAFGTDYQVEPLNPMEGLYAAVTRKDRHGEEGQGWFPAEKLTMEEAIRNYTLQSAYAQFMEDRKGKLKPGYLADIIILEKDLFNMPENEIMSNWVDMTITGGRIVYDRLQGYSLSE
jgi:predicted amidohydrolase YtcJ